MALVFGWISAGRRMQIVKTAKPRAGLIEPSLWGRGKDRDIASFPLPDLHFHLKSRRCIMWEPAPWYPW